MAESVLLTAQQIADRLSLDKSHVYQLIKREMRHVRIGRSVRVDPSEFERWLASRAQEPKLACLRRQVPRSAQRKAKGSGVRPSQLFRRSA